MAADHSFALSIEWTGNRGTGTSGYRDYERSGLITAGGKEPIASSSARVFHGDEAKWNPEELLIAALAECHMLSYLHTALRNGVIVTAYTDDATGTVVQEGDGGHFTEVTPHPRVTVADAAQIELAQRIHAEAAANCFIAASMNFPVHHQPTTLAP